MMNGKGEQLVAKMETRRRSATSGQAVVAEPRHIRRRPEDLTHREQEILELVWGGFTNRVIADRLNISIKTAEAHRANIMKKLRVSNTAQMLKAALEGGLLQATTAAVV